MAAADPSLPAHRTKAHKLRALQKAGTIDPTDALWLHDYEDKQKRSKNYGSSRSAREVNATFHMKEAAEAEGTGSAAIAAASAALVAKEEGRRLDALLLNAVDAMKASAEINRQTALMLKEDYGSIFELMIRRTEVLEQTHIEMLQTVRTHHLAATQLEGALIQREAEAKPEDQLLMMLMSKYLGVPVDQVAAVAAAGGTNGAPPRPPQRRPQRPPPKTPPTTPPNGAAAK
jgi:hypothetical protein